MFKQGDIISYLDMCAAEGVNLQRGMNFRLRDGISVILMSVRTGAPYKDRVEQDGEVLIYEGHDVPRTPAVPDPKTVDQPLWSPGARLTQNGLFFRAAEQFKREECAPEPVRVYEKIKPGIWVHNGLFGLTDAWQEDDGRRRVFKFKLRLLDGEAVDTSASSQNLDHGRMIPTSVKLAVWKRDKGMCVRCSSTDNLHFDHIIPYSKGGSSLVVDNVQLLCARHNLEKRDRIE